MVQVFFSEITDLFKPSHVNKRKLTVIMDENHGVVTVENVTKLYFELDEIKQLLKAYEKSINTMRETFVNETSSRSHLIFAIMIEQYFMGEQEPYKVGKLTFIDLAGAESLAEIGVNPNRYVEGMQINESLKNLGRVINQASRKVKVSFDLHVLTQFMQDSLGGNSRTVMIANIAPSKHDLALTRQTLEYAVQAGTIINKPTNMSAESKLSKSREELEELQRLHKFNIINSMAIITSQRVIPTKRVNWVTGSVTVPELTTLLDKSLQQRKDLKITRV